MGDLEIGDIDKTDDPDKTDFERWRERQRAFAEVDARGISVVDEGGALQLDPVARSLAKLLWSFHDDGALWKLLRTQQVTLERLEDVQQVRLLAAADIDWVPFLKEAGYRPPPPVETLADEFRLDVRRAASNGSDLDLRNLRDRVADLATRLDQALADQRPGALAKLRSYLRIGLTVGRRAAVVHGVAAAAGYGVGAALTAAGLAPLAPIAVLVVGKATAAALDRALPSWDKAGADRRTDAGLTPAEVRALLRECLQPDENGRQGSSLRLLGSVTAGRPPGTSLMVVAHEMGPTMVEYFQSALGWIDRSLGAVFVAWEHAAGAGLSTAQLERLVDRFSRLRRVLADLGVNEPSLEELTRDVEADCLALVSGMPKDH